MNNDIKQTKVSFTKEYVEAVLTSIVNIILIFYFSNDQLVLSMIGMEATIIFIFILGSLNEKLPEGHFIKRNAHIIFSTLVTIVIALLFYLFFAITIAAGSPQQEVIEIIVLLLAITILPVYYLIYRIFKKKK